MLSLLCCVLLMLLCPKDGDLMATDDGVPAAS